MPFNCDKHGHILYGNTCLNCVRESRSTREEEVRSRPRLTVKDIMIGVDDLFQRIEKGEAVEGVDYISIDANPNPHDL